MADNSLTVRLVVAWWVRPYLLAIVMFADLFGLQPDVDKVLATVRRGFRVKVD